MGSCWPLAVSDESVHWGARHWVVNACASVLLIVDVTAGKLHHMHV
jgi:hypothetical protein